ncbi:MAG TPA: thioredoxin domain-containing protein [Firmicutes bacterium]|nr:thioredoxin domain-containing protein [Bacillota bacterium]
MTTGTKTANRLIKEKSPYLLQHAHNPVDWYPWGEEAFARAKAEDKPIFLSIGYSTCHWCHVMERESFEDEEVAEILNKCFVAIKVDREERPDIDHIYMLACQAITGQGGWPLTIFMTPEKKPFYAGTYFPKESKFGRPGLLDILATIHEQWITNREELIKAGEQMTKALQSQPQDLHRGELGEYTLQEAYHSLQENYDETYGGFGSVPKFPTPHNLLFLLRYWYWSGDKKALSMVKKTLESMHRGGIYDHLGYGFARYSVDQKWLVPHFEKMLYDNALLAMAYLEGYQVTGKERFARIAREIFAYVLRDMTSPDGAFYTAEDADSEGEEGKFYTWTPAEIKAILGTDLGEEFCRWYGVTEAGNFAGKNILNRVRGEALITAGDPREEDHLAGACQRLFAAREKRIHPHKDDKILTSWNGLMIAALAMGARILSESRYLEAAARALEFIWTHLRKKEGRLLARYRNGEAAYPGYLDDYATLIWALLELYQADQKPAWLRRALTLQEEQDRLFLDERQGGYFFTGRDSEELLTRPKEVYDSAIPSGNSISALNLLRLARLTGREEFTDRAKALFRTFSGTVSRYPAGYTFFLTALHFALAPGRDVVVAAAQSGEKLRRELAPLTRIFAPTTTFLYRSEGKDAEELKALAPFTAKMRPLEGKTTYYICENFACRQPTTEREEVRRTLAEKKTPLAN